MKPLSASFWFKAVSPVTDRPITQLVGPTVGTVSVSLTPQSAACQCWFSIDGTDSWRCTDDRILPILIAIASGDENASAVLSDLIQEYGGPDYLWMAIGGDPGWYEPYYIVKEGLREGTQYLQA